MVHPPEICQYGFLFLTTSLEETKGRGGKNLFRIWCFIQNLHDGCTYTPHYYNEL